MLAYTFLAFCASANAEQLRTAVILTFCRDFSCLLFQIFQIKTKLF